jgi:hypothetical protein
MGHEEALILIRRGRLFIRLAVNFRSLNRSSEATSRGDTTWDDRKIEKKIPLNFRANTIRARSGRPRRNGFNIA